MRTSVRELGVLRRAPFYPSNSSVWRGGGPLPQPPPPFARTYRPGGDVETLHFPTQTSPSSKRAINERGQKADRRSRPSAKGRFGSILSSTEVASHRPGVRFTGISPDCARPETSLRIASHSGPVDRMLNNALPVRPRNARRRVGPNPN